MTRAREAVEEPKPAGRMGVELVCCRIIMGEPLLMKMEMRVLRSIILRSVVIMMVAVEDESSSAAERGGCSDPCGSAGGGGESSGRGGRRCWLSPSYR